MAQNPLIADQVDIEPGSSGTRRISRATDGSLQFRDPTISAVVLSALVGLRNITGVYLVGRAGDGAAYTSIQDALDAIPDTSSPEAPSVVLVMPGVYTENLTVAKDGVQIQALGPVTISNVGASPTVLIEASPLSTPTSVIFSDLTLTNDQDNTACVVISGAGTYATGTVTVNNALVAGDTLTIGGVVLTAVMGARDSGEDNFSIDGTTTAQVAAEIAAAILDPENSFEGIVAAEVALSVVSLAAVTPGATGNDITLAYVTTPTDGLTLSGANLEGGSSSGSAVGSDKVLFKDCRIVVTGAGAWQVDARTVNNVWVSGGTFEGSSNCSVFRAVDCASVTLEQVAYVSHIEVAYIQGDDEPAQAGQGFFKLHGIRRCGPMSLAFLGIGSATISDVALLGSVILGGDGAVDFTGCRFTGNVSLADTVPVTVVGSTGVSGNLTLAGGTPTLDIDYLRGAAAFESSTAHTVAFDVPRSNTSYTVSLEAPGVGTSVAVTNKTAEGFDIEADPVFTGTINYIIHG